MGGRTRYPPFTSLALYHSANSSLFETVGERHRGECASRDLFLEPEFCALFGSFDSGDYDHLFKQVRKYPSANL